MPRELFLLVHQKPPEAQYRFRAVSQRLQAILPTATDIQHVGATAVPSCLTKGDLDVCVRVEQDAFAACDAALERHFERNAESERSESFSAFLDMAANIGIQLVTIGSPLDVFATFRDLLLKNPKLLARYNQLKQRYHGKSMTQYRKAKDKFIQSALSSV